MVLVSFQNKGVKVSGGTLRNGRILSTSNFSSLLFFHTHANVPFLQWCYFTVEGTEMSKAWETRGRSPTKKSRDDESHTGLCDCRSHDLKPQARLNCTFLPLRCLVKKRRKWAKQRKLLKWCAEVLGSGVAELWYFSVAGRSILTEINSR